MNSKQRRARIRAGMPGVLHRILTMKLMGDISTSIADKYLQQLRADNLSLTTFERIVRAAAEIERQAELRATLKGYVSPTGRMSSYSPVFQSMPRSVGANPNLGAGYGGKTAYTIVFDEATTIK